MSLETAYETILALTQNGKTKFPVGYNVMTPNEKALADMVCEAYNALKTARDAIGKHLGRADHVVQFQPLPPLTKEFEELVALFNQYQKGT